MNGKFKVLVMALCILSGLVEKGRGANSLTQQCGNAIQQVTSCLSFASGKANEPTKECCTAVSSMRDKQPVCLCFFIGQAHNGSEAIKSLGVQEAKLLQLPSACHLVNASASDCPRLLGISPSSPAAAIFNASAPTSTPTSTAGSSSGNISDGSNQAKSNALFGSLFAIILTLISLSATTSLDLPIGILQSLF